MQYIYEYILVSFCLFSIIAGNSQCQWPITHTNNSTLSIFTSFFFTNTGIFPKLCSHQGQVMPKVGCRAACVFTLGNTLPQPQGIVVTWYFRHISAFRPLKPNHCIHIDNIWHVYRPDNVVLPFGGYNLVIIITFKIGSFRGTVNLALVHNKYHLQQCIIPCIIDCLEIRIIMWK